MTTQDSLRQHTLYSVADHLVDAVLALAELFRSVETLTARVTSITCVDFIRLLLAGEHDLGCIDDDYIVTTVYVWSESRLVLSAKQLGYLRAKATYNLIAGIDNDPLLLSCFLVDGNSLVT